MNRALPIWIILGLLVLIILAVLAFRTPNATEEAVQETATTTAQAVDRTAARTEAAVELTALRARIEAGETYDALEDDFTDVRNRLASAYENAEGAARDEWQDISADFDAFEEAARTGTSDFLDTLTRLIDRFSADVRVETQGE